MAAAWRDARAEATRLGSEAQRQLSTAHGNLAAAQAELDSLRRCRGPRELAAGWSVLFH